MSKKKLVLVDDHEINLDDMIIVTPLSQIAKMVAEERIKAEQEIINIIKPWITGSTGLRLLSRYGVSSKTLVMDNSPEIPETGYKAKSYSKPRLVNTKTQAEYEVEDFSSIIQFITR